MSSRDIFVLGGGLGQRALGSDSLLGIDPRMSRTRFVVYPLARVQKVKPEEAAQIKIAAVQQAEGAKVVGRIGKSSDPRGSCIIREGRFCKQPTLKEDATTEDAVAAFYIATIDFKEFMDSFTKETIDMADLDPELVPLCCVVTIVDQELHARPVGTERMKEEDFEGWGGDRGFELAAEFRQYVVVGMTPSEIDQYEIFSEKGEYPIKPPSTLDIGLMLRMDKVAQQDDLLNAKMTPAQRRTRLAARLGSV